MQMETSLSTLTEATKRIRALGDTMFELKALGECTEVLLYAEGFSPWDLRTFGDAARQWARERSVRFVDDEQRSALPGRQGNAGGFTRPDHELVDIALHEIAGLLDEDDIADALTAKGFAQSTIKRIWKQLMVKVAAYVATRPLPQFEASAAPVMS